MEPTDNTAHLPPPLSELGPDKTALPHGDMTDLNPTNSGHDTNPPASQLRNDTPEARPSMTLSALPPSLWSTAESSSQPTLPSAPPPIEPDTQVEQYKDDLALHTQLQLQLYLEDLEMAEAEAQQVEAALTASLHPSNVGHSNTLNPLQNGMLPQITGTFSGAAAGPTNMPSEQITTQSFQQQMLSLESTALAAAASGANIGFSHDSLGLEHGLGLELRAGPGGGHEHEHGHGHFSTHMPDDVEDDDEECLPPSETKYILYDDHVSPVNIAHALVVLNDNLYEDLVDGMMDQGTGTDDNRCRSISLSHLDHDGNRPIYSAFSSTLATTSKSTHAADKGEGDLLEKDDYALDVMRRNIQGESASSCGEVDTNCQPSHADHDGTRQDHTIALGLLSPPPGSKSGFFDEDDLEEEKLQGRPSHQGGPDISLNLAGNVISPITVHDLFFSRFYSRLVYLNLWDTNLGIWGAQAVGGLMADRACRVQYLNLGCNRLGFEGIVQLSGLYKNNSLVELDLSENHLGPKAVHSLQQIVVRLQKDKACNIRRLNLSNNEINDVGCISIAKIILGTVLTHLDLSFNKISDWGASTILAAFESNELSLKDINLEANPLSFAGGVDICKILVLPQSRITHLDLRGAKVTDVGIPYLAEALKSHQCPLMSLNLYDCQLTDAGILKLAIKLSVNKSLRVLGLGCNCIGDMGILALSQGLCLNNYLEELDLSENDVAVSRAGLEALISAMRSNTSLLDLRLDVDGHPHDISRTSGGGLYPDFDGATDYQHPQHLYLLPYHQEPQQEHELEPSQIIENTSEALANINPLEFMVPSEAQVGEVLAPTHAALAQPLQVPLFSPPIPPPILQIHSQPQPQLHPHHHGYFAPGVAAVPALNEQDLERERKLLMLALATLKTYVRHNYKRTSRMHKLCFEVLVMARVVMFAKDATVFGLPAAASSSSSSPSPSSSFSPYSADLGHRLHMNGSKVMDSAADVDSSRWRDCEANCGSLLAVIPLQTGLPTPPLLQDTEQDLKTEVPLPGNIQGGTGALKQSQSDVSSPGPRGTLAGVPWEIKEMILRSLDREGLLSERQFQAIVTYAGLQWETVRRPWERWGEIRETILEKTRCYYYEP